jgi:serine/threonine protein phosphatase PrpC
MACVLLLHSEGLWNSIDRDGELADAVRQQTSGAALSLASGRWPEDLQAIANERGGHDNVPLAVLMEEPVVIPSEKAESSASAASSEPQTG